MITISPLCISNFPAKLPPLHLYDPSFWVQQDRKNTIISLSWDYLSKIQLNSQTQSWSHSTIFKYYYRDTEWDPCIFTILWNWQPHYAITFLWKKRQQKEETGIQRWPRERNILPIKSQKNTLTATRNTEQIPVHTTLITFNMVEVHRQHLHDMDTWRQSLWNSFQELEQPP